MGKARALNILRSAHEKTFACSMCRYTSNRYFNIARHERRIHTVPKKRPQCCDTTFETKGAYYRHCEEVHPNKRMNLTSQIKYGIRADSILNETIDDVNATGKINEEYPQTRYMLRNRPRPRDTAKFAENSSDSDDYNDVDEISKKSTNESSRREARQFSPMNPTPSSSEPPDDGDTCGLDSSSDEDPQNNEESSEDDSQTDDQGSSSNDGVLEDNETPMKIDEVPNPVFEQRDNLEHFDHEQAVEPSEDIFLSSENCSTPSGIGEFASAGQKRAINEENHESKIAVDSFIPTTSTPSNLPLKKRILQDLVVQNRENIEKSRKPMGDRLYRAAPMKLERPIKRISKKGRKSKEDRPILKNPMIASKSRSISNDAENVPPGVSFAQSDETFKVEIRKNVKFSWQQVTDDHAEYLNTSGIWLAIEKLNEGLNY